MLFFCSLILIVWLSNLDQQPSRWAKSLEVWNRREPPRRWQNKYYETEKKTHFSWQKLWKCREHPQKHSLFGFHLFSQQFKSLQATERITQKCAFQVWTGQVCTYSPYFLLQKLLNSCSIRVGQICEEEAVQSHHLAAGVTVQYSSVCSISFLSASVAYRVWTLYSVNSELTVQSVGICRIYGFTCTPTSNSTFYGIYCFINVLSNLIGKVFRDSFVSSRAKALWQMRTLHYLLRSKICCSKNSLGPPSTADFLKNWYFLQCLLLFRVCGEEKQIFVNTFQSGDFFQNLWCSSVDEEQRFSETTAKQTITTTHHYSGQSIESCQNWCLFVFWTTRGHGAWINKYSRFGRIFCQVRQDFFSIIRFFLWFSFPYDGQMFHSFYYFCMQRGEK